MLDKGKQIVTVTKKKEPFGKGDSASERPFKRSNKGIVIRDLVPEAEVAQQLRLSQ